MAWDVGIPQDDPCAIRHGPRLAALPQPAPVAGCQTCGRFVSARSTRAENSPYADTMPPLALPAILHLARPEERRHARGVRRGGEPRDARGPGLRADRPARRASHPDGATADPWIGRLPRAARGGPPTAHDEGTLDTLTACPSCCADRRPGSRRRSGTVPCRAPGRSPRPSSLPRRNAAPSPEA